MPHLDAHVEELYEQTIGDAKRNILDAFLEKTPSSTQAWFAKRRSQAEAKRSTRRNSAETQASTVEPSPFSVPGAMGEYYLASGITAGVIGTAHEIANDSSIARVSKLIDASEAAMINPDDAETTDARRQLLAVADEVLRRNGNNAIGLRAISHAQLLTLRSAARRASLSLLREPGTTESEEERTVVERLIDGERDILARDAETLASVLLRFSDDALDDRDHALARFAEGHDPLSRMSRYIMGFVRGAAISATGIPEETIAETVKRLTPTKRITTATATTRYAN